MKITNTEAVGKYIIIMDIYFTDYMKDVNDEIKVYDTYEEALTTCGFYEFEDALIVKIESNYREDGEYLREKRDNNINKIINE